MINTLHKIPWLYRWFANQNCFLCNENSHTLICDYCLHDTYIDGFVVPGSNLMEQPKIHQYFISPEFDELYAIGFHNGILAKLISTMKFQRKALAAKVLFQFFKAYVLTRYTQLNDPPDMIIAVPLSKWRYQQREFNQAVELANHISNDLNIPIFYDVVRTRHTKQQSALKREERIKNTENAFMLKVPLQANHVAIVDDVVTTGSTVNSLCRTLRKDNPALKITLWAMTIAKME